MNSKLFLRGAVGLIVALAAACNDDHQSTSPPMQPTSQSLDTAQVLALARDTSETSPPMAVNGGALTLNDTSETSAPVAVNAM